MKRALVYFIFLLAFLLPNISHATATKSANRFENNVKLCSSSQLGLHSNVDEYFYNHLSEITEEETDDDSEDESCSLKTRSVENYYSVSNYFYIPSLKTIYYNKYSPSQHSSIFILLGVLRI